MTIQDIQHEIVDEFSMFDDWMQRYEYIIELGKTLPIIDERYKVDENIIKGCQSKVWVHGEEQDGKIVFTADSDAILTKGIIAVLIRAFSNQTPSSILEANTDFIDESQFSVAVRSFIIALRLKTETENLKLWKNLTIQST
jgi:cysteine desulfuration protein SufE